MKQFGFNLDETLRFADFIPDYGAIIKGDVPINVLDKLNVTNGQIDAAIFKNGVLTIENQAELDLLNSSITNIEQAY